MSREQAYSIVERLLQCFPVLNLASPEVYTAELCVLFCGYPWWAGLAVLDAAKFAFRFPPSLAELRPLLEDQVRYPRAMQAKARLMWLDQQRLLEPPRKDRPSYDELKARYGEHFGIVQCEVKPPPVPLPSWEQVAEFYRSHPERWHALIKPREEGMR